MFRIGGELDPSEMLSRMGQRWYDGAFREEQGIYNPDIVQWASSWPSAQCNHIHTRLRIAQYHDILEVHTISRPQPLRSTGTHDQELERTRTRGSISTRGTNNGSILSSPLAMCRYSQRGGCSACLPLCMPHLSSHPSPTIERAPEQSIDTIPCCYSAVPPWYRLWSGRGACALSCARTAPIPMPRPSLPQQYRPWTSRQGQFAIATGRCPSPGRVWDPKLTRRTPGRSTRSTVSIRLQEIGLPSPQPTLSLFFWPGDWRWAAGRLPEWQNAELRTEALPAMPAMGAWSVASSLSLCLLISQPLAGSPSLSTPGGGPRGRWMGSEDITQRLAPLGQARRVRKTPRRRI